MSRLVTDEQIRAHPERYRGKKQCSYCMAPNTTTGFSLRIGGMSPEVSDDEVELLRAQATKLGGRRGLDVFTPAGFGLCRLCGDELDIPVSVIRPEIPRWECGGNYAKAVDGALRTLTTINVRQLLAGEKCHAHVAWLLDVMLDAHVAVLDIEPYRVLPDDDDPDYTPDPHLPFNPLYVSIGDEDCAGVLLVTRPSDGEAVWTFKFADAWGLILPVRFIAQGRDASQPLIETPSGRSERAATNSGDALKVAHFLESFNVDLEEAQPSRQVRRNAERHPERALPIAMRVDVHSNAKRYPKRNGQPGEAHYDYRFEVRGHYRHSGPDTPVFKATLRDRPEKIIEHPTRGQIVRKWIPGYVKGPEDRPPVPKVRVYKQDPTTPKEGT